MLKALRDVYRRKRYGPPVVVVSGLPRSGTSMMMKMLDAGGMPLVTDAARAADEDNPRGYFEDDRVKQLNKAGDRAWLRSCRGKAIKVISLLLPELPEENFYQVVFMRRNFDEVIASQNKMLVRRGEPAGEANDRKMIESYKMHLRKVEFLLEDRPNFASIDVDYREALADPRLHAARVRDFLGADLDLDKMAAAVDARLYRNRS